MATMNFSVPEDLKQAFNHAFAGQNKSAIIAAMMAQAIADKERQQRQERAIDDLLAIRATLTPVTDDEVRRARLADRP